MKEKVSVATYLLDSTSLKLKSLSKGLKRRDQRYFEKCIEAKIANNHLKAIMYANECAVVRKYATLVMGSELALEQAILRLQTINNLGDVFETIGPIVKIVEETRGNLIGIIPSVAGRLNEVNSMIKSSFSEMGSVKVVGNHGENSSEAMKILKQANLTADEKIRERFPQLPEELESSEEITESRIPVALTANGGSLEISPSLLNLSPKDIEKILKLKDESQMDNI